MCSTEFWAHFVTIYKLLRIYPKFCLWIIPRTMIHLTRFFPPTPWSHLWYSPLRNFCVFIANLSRYSSPTVIKIAALGRENYWIKLLSRNHEIAWTIHVILNKKRYRCLRSESSFPGLKLKSVTRVNNIKLINYVIHDEEVKERIELLNYLCI